MKIRFYHWWVYKIYQRMWNPIFAKRPDMVRAIYIHLDEYMERYKLK